MTIVALQYLSVEHPGTLESFGVIAIGMIMLWSLMKEIRPLICIGHILLSLGSRRSE